MKLNCSMLLYLISFKLGMYNVVKLGILYITGQNMYVHLVHNLYIREYLVD